MQCLVVSGCTLLACGAQLHCARSKTAIFACDALFRSIADATGSDCPQDRDAATAPQSVIVAGAGSGLLGYCRVAAASLVDKGLLALNASADSSRERRARRVRVTVDPVTPSARDPRLVVYYSNDVSDTGLRPVVNVSFSNVSTLAEILIDPSVKWGIASEAHSDSYGDGIKGEHAYLIEAQTLTDGRCFGHVRSLDFS